MWLPCHELVRRDKVIERLIKRTSDVKPAMNQVAVIFVLLLTLMVVVSAEGNGNSTEGNATATQYNRGIFFMFLL